MPTQKRKLPYMVMYPKRARVMRTQYSTSVTAPAPTRVELKYDDGTLSGNISSTPQVNLLTTIPNGSGASERVGRRILYHDMQIQWVWRFAANHGGPNHARFSIVYDSSPNGVAPAYLDIFAINGVEALQNPDTRGRFKILYESKCVTYNDTTTGEIQYNNMNGNKVISLKGKSCQFIGTGFTIADIEKGAIYLVTNSSQNNVVALDFTNRIQFSDS